MRVKTASRSAEEKIVETFTEIKSLIEKNKGIVIAEEAPKSVRLAYTIVKTEGGKRQKFDTTFFSWIKFEMSPEDAVSLKEALCVHDALLRCLLFKTARESTLAPKKVFFEKTETRPAPKPLAKPKAKKEIPRETISEEELDKTIEELVSET